jgi:hypothetical protein
MGESLRKSHSHGGDWRFCIHEWRDSMIELED